MKPRSLCTLSLLRKLIVTDWISTITIKSSISHGKKDEEKGESNVYNQSRVTVLRSALKQVFKGTFDQFCFYVYEAFK